MRLRSKTELAALAALAYVPFLASSPGKVSADSKQDLFLEPGRFLRRAVELWDPHLGGGTVPHQNLGYLMPTGPWFWALDRLGVPDWVAQRLWLGTISLCAVLGARWLFRQLGTGSAGALAGALVYLLTPYQLAFTARMSVLLLPWAALPWLVGLTMRATRTRDWRAPAAAAVVLLAAGGINASSLVLVLVAPAVWVLLELGRGRGAARRALAATGRLVLVGTGISLWWLVGLRLQAAHGLPVLQLTESVREVALFSSPHDLLRGLGNWFFYGRDQVGYSVDQAADYATNDLVIALSYVVPAAGLGAALLVRWAHRTYFALLVVVGTVLAAGAWPYDDPSPYGSLWRSFTAETSVGLALRNSPRAVPVIVLGFAGLLAAAVGSLPPPRWRAAGAAAVAVAALGALLPVGRHGFLTEGMLRPERLPGHWVEAAAAIDAGDPSTRVLEIPGSSFAAYRWGTTVDPITPGLVDRPYLAREVLPSGTVGTVNLLDALDRRMQQGWFEPAALAPVARLLGVGTVSLRADLDQSGRFDTPPPLPLWDALRTDRTGLRSPVTFGPPGGDGTVATLPSVALFDVEAPRPIVRTAPTDGPVVLAGDGDGIVDAAAAGLLDGSSLVLPAAALDDSALTGALAAGAHLVLTDSNRRRIQTWFYSLRDTRGQTERAGEIAADPTGYDVRLDPFAGSSDDSRTVVEQLGGQVDASRGGGPERPEDRAARALDGDVTTAWRVAGADPRGSVLTLRPDVPVVAGEVRLVQAPVLAGARTLTQVAVTIDGGTPIVVDLGPEAATPEGQAVRFERREVREVRVELLQTAPPSPTAGEPAPVGLAEVRVGSTEVHETVRLPVDLLDRTGSDLDGHGLDIVLTRLRLEVDEADRGPDEARLDRTVELPIARSFRLTGTARPAAVGTSAATTSTGGCRADLLLVDGQPLPVRLSEGDGDGAWSLEACAPVTLSAGRHRLVAAAGRASGLDIDRVVLSSDRDGQPTAVGPRGRPAGASGAAVQILRQGPSTLDLEVRSDGAPFWLVLAQSHSDAWDATLEGGTLGPQQLVDGYANGWLVTPDRAGPLTVSLRWSPQRLVWVGFALSAATLLGCALVLWRGRRRPMPATGLAAPPGLWWDAGAPDRSGAARRVAALLTGGLGLLVASPGVAAGAAVVTLIAGRGRWRAVLLAGSAAGALLVSRAADRPGLAWLAILVIAGDLLGERPAASPLRTQGRPRAARRAQRG